MFQLITQFITNTICDGVTVSADVIHFYAIGLTMIISSLPFYIVWKLIARWF